MPGVRVGKGAQLRRVIVEEDVRVPAGFCAGFDIEQDRIRQIATERGVLVIVQNQVSAASRMT
jgi:glucose-1-phosphate adenylyltransferase